MLPGYKMNQSSLSNPGPLCRQIKIRQLYSTVTAAARRTWGTVGLAHFLYYDASDELLVHEMIKIP
jgi:hypothetical protein